MASLKVMAEARSAASLARLLVARVERVDSARQSQTVLRGEFAGGG